MCQWLAVSSSAFFDWRRRPQSATAARRDRLKTLISHEFAASDETYGHRRIHAALQRSGVPCSAELVRALMRELGLQPCQPRPWRHSLTAADDRAPALPDLVGRNFTADAPGRKLIGDITYIPTWEGWLYLATVIDCHTKMVIGYAMGDDYKTPLISAALHHAAQTFPLEPDAIFHSDRGSNGGLNWSSQHLVISEVCDGATSAAGGSGSAAGDALAGSADAGPPCGARVLAPNRAGQAHRGRR